MFDSTSRIYINMNLLNCFGYHQAIILLNIQVLLGIGIPSVEGVVY